MISTNSQNKREHPLNSTKDPSTYPSLLSLFEKDFQQQCLRALLVYYLKNKTPRTQIKYSDFVLGIQERSNLSTDYDWKGACFTLENELLNPQDSISWCNNKRDVSEWWEQYGSNPKNEGEAGYWISWCRKKLLEWESFRVRVLFCFTWI